MMNPKMLINHPTRSKDIEDIHMLVQLRSMENIAQLLVEI
jgi:hypothetical protein